MQELNLRLGQAVALTYAQEDDNFKRLKAAIDALEIAIAGSTSGTVTSVGLALPNIFTVTNSPVISAGTLTATFASQAANRVLASPDSISGIPSFRSLLAADLPVIPITKGGTELTSPILNNYVLASNGSGYEGRRLLAGDGLTISQSTGLIQFALDFANINLSDLSGVLTANKGGTGISAVPANGELLIGNGTSWTKNLLTAGSGISIVNGIGTIEIRTSGVITQAGGVGNYVTKFSLFSSDTITNSIIYDTGARIGVNTALPAYDVDIQQYAGGGADTVLRVYNSAVGFGANLRAEGVGGNYVNIRNNGFIFSNNTKLDFHSGTIGQTFYADGNTAFRKGFALSGFVYWNTASNYVFSSNNQYGVILGPTSPNTMTVTLPATPMDGQEVCILCEEAKILTLIATGSTIFGHNAGVNIDVVITGGTPAGAASIIVKYAGAANGGLGAWFITGI
jgi:hypothetical protein